MDWKDKIKEELLKYSIQIVLGLIALLSFAVWEAVPSSVWGRISEATPKRGLWALLALEAIAILLESALLFLHYRRARKETQPPEPVQAFGVLRDEELNPLCPAHKMSLRVVKRLEGRPRHEDILECQICGREKRIPLITTDSKALTLTEAQQLLTSQPKISN
jgi:hypothetical protein